MNRFLFLLLAVAIFSSSAAGQAAPPFWRDILAFKKADSTMLPAEGSILFVGSSSFTRWNTLKEDFAGYPVVNRGFGGSSLTDVIRYFYDIILPYRPKQVVIYCGENDLAASDTVSAAEVVRRFKTLYGMIRTNLPQATVHFVSIKPSPSRIHLLPKMKEANREVQAFLKKEKRAGYIDVHTAMLDASGKPKEALFVEDRLHITPQGYLIWKTIIRPYLLK